MRFHSLFLLALICASAGAAAQTKTRAPLQVYAGYSWLSNSFNGVPASPQPLNGWNAGVAFQPWHHLRFRLDYSMYRGLNLGAPQHAFFIMGGGQYEVAIHRERLYALALTGEGGLNGTWFKGNPAGFRNHNTGTIASFAEFLGGGIDTPVARRAAIRIEGGVQHSNFVPIEPSPRSQPYHLDGIPNYFGRFSVGVVWLPRLRPVVHPGVATHTPVESELIFEGLRSFGHFHLFANSWWSYLSAGGLEYDRHSWGSVLGAHVDYSAEILPVMILRQPSKTDIWGNRQSDTFETVPGVAILPIGMRLLWLDSKRLKPYYEIKGGMTAYAQKAFSQDASYENFALDQSVGVECRVAGRFGFRGAFGVFHQSNGFVVPSNPGLDEMNWNTGISYHLGRQQAE